MIVQGDEDQAHGFLRRLCNKPGRATRTYGSNVRQQFNSITGVQAVAHRARRSCAWRRTASRLRSLPNDTVQSSGVMLPLSNKQLWPWATGAPVDWAAAGPDAPTIAIVDSGIDANRTDFAGRVARPGQLHEPRRRTPRVTATVTARSWRASPRARRPAMPASRRRRNSCRSTS